MTHWKCNKCSWTGDEPLIVPAMDGGNVVDIIDIMCPIPSCGGEPYIVGDEEEREKWWDDWYAKNDQKEMIEDYTMLWVDHNGVKRAHTEFNVTSKEHALSHALGNSLVNFSLIDYIGDFNNFFNVDFFLWTVDGKLR